MSFLPKLFPEEEMDPRLEDSPPPKVWPEGVLAIGHPDPRDSAPLEGGDTVVIRDGKATTVPNATRWQSDPPDVSVRRPAADTVGRDYIAGLQGQQPQPVAGDAGGPLGALAKTIMGAGFRPEVAQFVAKSRSGEGGDDELRRAQGLSSALSGLSMIGRASNTLGAAFSHSKPDQSFYDAADAQAGRPVADLMQRRGAAHQAQQDEIQRMALTKQQALMDPQSPESQRTRDAAKAMLSAAGMGDSPLIRTFDAMSGADIEKTLPSVQKFVDQQADRTQKDRIADQTDRYHRDEMRQRSLDRQAAIDAARGNRTDAANMKRDQQMQERQVPGFSPAEGTFPSADGAKKVRDLLAIRDSIKGDLDTLRGKFNKSGVLDQMGVGSDAATMNSAWMALTNALRTMNKMGVPNGRDYEMLANEIPKPTGAGALASRDSSMSAAYDELERKIDEKLAASAHAFGYVPTGGKPPPTSGFPDHAAPVGPHGATVKQNGITYTWNPATQQYE